ncbi:glycerophosphoryl diester phosphodiesterase membrane domain-containing protein [Microbacterium sp. LRZ72]|uniref:glycerophosphoryl diester phosphodiesterase membrane domain-containing protein n=1 Tax=Microbacterium sp. LRZ72 TaxID=2942481 RepID=UPI00299FAD4B|nr:glycerophosphoryl diester phosphodiesterase membrane domain-containing protein [Microbacterium sp. LRZ72]MDX2377052.1 glycerophosphoryl diester phosphodiesterase membrane domain-containing protein [Microbacterium sp. LRZ72]
MTAYPAWTPAPRPGIIPLHPLTFGMILGRSFSALRHNPRVLLGFALGTIGLVYLLLIAGIGGVAWLSYSRLDTVTPGTDDWDAITAGSTLITGLTAFVLGLLAMAMQIIVQAVVVGEVAHAAVAEKLTVGALWRRVRPAIWRLLGYSLLVFVAIAVFVAVVVGVVVLIAVTTSPLLAIPFSVLAVLGAIPLYLWLSTKLLLVPGALILERAGLFAAIGRSWRLIRGRFWPALGVIVLISLLFGTVSQFVSLPLSFAGSGLTTIFSPTGEPTSGAVIALIVTLGLTYIITLLVQAVAIVVQATASTLIYVDCRMRHEGLDIDLLSYVERRDAGVPDLADPWTMGIGRAAPATHPASPPAPVPGAPAPGSPATPARRLPGDGEADAAGGGAAVAPDRDVDAPRDATSPPQPPQGGRPASTEWAAPGDDDAPPPPSRGA